MKVMEKLLDIQDDIRSLKQEVSVSLRHANPGLDTVLGQKFDALIQAIKEGMILCLEGGVSES